VPGPRGGVLGKALAPAIDEREGRDVVRKWNARLSHYFHIPFPEELPDRVYWEKVEQLRWFLKKEHGNGQF